MKKIIPILLVLCLISGCTSETPSPTTVVIEEHTSALPEGEAANSSGRSAGGCYEPDELDGVAGETDTLPDHESYEEARAANPHVIGWLAVDGTAIDYPVLRTTDNDFYLTHDADGNDSKYGAIFMDYRNGDPDRQQHIIIYGHNMKNGTMFHDLVNYKQADFFDANRMIQLLWDDRDTRWEVFCAYIVEPDTIYPIKTAFEDNDAFAADMNDAIKYAGTVSPSVIATDVTIQPSDQVLSLVTCTYEYDDSRYVVMARRIK